MPLPLKPCEGRIGEATQQLLNRNRDRAQWAAHPCEVCGLSVAVSLEKGKWVPERHWPSVTYPIRQATRGQNPERLRLRSPERANRNASTPLESNEL